jgi:hypothetical protein
MPNYQVISRTIHADTHWQRVASHSFAAAEALAPVMAQEMAKAALSLPLGFIPGTDNFSLVAIQGLQTGQNLFVNSRGKWIAHYVPAVYRSYPFGLASTEDGKPVLTVDVDSGLLSNDPVGEPFFDEARAPSKGLVDVLSFLTQVKAGRAVTERICANLKQHNLIQPWPLKIRNGTEEITVEGLFRIDEEALNALNKDALAEVRDSGGLSVAYLQLVSMQHLVVLEQLARARVLATTADAQPVPDALNFDGLADNGTISFANL